MAAMAPHADFDARPPLPVDEYARTVAGVNVGYDLVFTLASCFLRALDRPNLELLVVGAGGGAEIARFLPGNPGWRLVGVDPSSDMLALAQASAERLGVQDRVELVRGTVDDLPIGRRFDAATCLYVLHFLPDEAKLALLRGIAARLRPQAPLLAASGTRVDALDLGGAFLGAWQQHGELMGLPAERMAATIQQLVAQQAGATTAAEYLCLLREAGFPQAAPFLSVMNGGMVAWIARPDAA
jgi:tRNA (cmo5U34)-methyltransferase